MVNTPPHVYCMYLTLINFFKTLKIISSAVKKHLS